MSGTPHDFITSFLMQYINKPNRCINPIWASVPPKLNVPRNPAAHRKTNHLIRYAKWTEWFLYVPPKNFRLILAQNGFNLKKKGRVKVVIFCKFFVALIIFYIKPTCFNKHLHKWQGQSNSYFLTFVLND